MNLKKTNTKVQHCDISEYQGSQNLPGRKSPTQSMKNKNGMTVNGNTGIQKSMEQCLHSSQKNYFQPRIPYLVNQKIKILLYIQGLKKILPPMHPFSRIYWRMYFRRIKEKTRKRMGKKQILHTETIKLYKKENLYTSQLNRE